MKPITALAFEGGGAKGAAYIGVVKALDAKAVLPGVQQVVGTSAGSGAAAMIALGYTPAEFARITMDQRASDILDIPLAPPFPLLNIAHGLCSGRNLSKWLKSLVRNKTGDENSTFADIRGRGPALTVVGTDVAAKKPFFFNANFTPKMPVWKALRISCSVPVLLKPVNWDHRRWIDGGAVLNYPLAYLDQLPGGAVPNPGAIGFLLGDPSRPGNRSRLPQPLGYYSDCWESFVRAQDVALDLDPSRSARTIVIDTGDISWLDFGLSDAKKQRLAAAGESATLEFLSRRP